MNYKDFITEHWKRQRSRNRDREPQGLQIKTVVYFNCHITLSINLTVACLTNEEVSTDKIMRRELHLTGYVGAQSLTKVNTWTI